MPLGVQDVPSKSESGLAGNFDFVLPLLSLLLLSQRLQHPSLPTPPNTLATPEGSGTPRANRHPQ